MRQPTLRASWQWILAGALLVLLLILAFLQYRWLNEVSEADRQKTRAVLQAAVDRFAHDFNRELTRAFLVFHPSPAGRPRGPRDASQQQDRSETEGSSDTGEARDREARDSEGRDSEGRGREARDREARDREARHHGPRFPRRETLIPRETLAERYERWQTLAPFPELLQAVYEVRFRAGTGAELARFDPDRGELSVVPWPPELSTTWERMRDALRPDSPDPPNPGPTFLADDVPALLIPTFGFPSPGRRGRPGHSISMAPFSLLILTLDQQILNDVLLAELSERHLERPDGSRYLVRIVDRQDALVFQTGDATIRTRDAVDASAQLFALLPADQLARAGLDAELASFRRPESEPRGRGGRRFGEGRRLSRIYPLVSSPEQARWQLLVNHPEGSLDAVVARAHRNNLAISFGILLLLATSLLLMLLSTRRLQALAKQQLEFIAGVTHELLTPLAAMRSAGQNLADGVVSEPAQVQRYGRLIEDEGRRLTGMVGQVLEFAGMQAGRKTYSLRPADPGKILTRALDEYRPMLEEKAFEIETHLDDSLPRIPADPPALHRAIQNLIANAIKYGADGAWIGLEARRSEKPHGSGVTLTVADRGPGIAAADRPRLFEPFFRGRNVADEQIPGSGLGLSLVQHIVEGHGGSVRVETEEGQGSRFILWLPAKEGDHE